ncbi:nitroreductase family protein [Bradyrhizobium sp. SRL28]|uniref:nitroreductase family protein n=1 Tax=Bradyrhizobium sp. SRL28 TaxID=2836178 RepID=UPI0027DFF1DC|nr:nitroreductase family protein [Bradyrhizobium sp. SRL28]
MLADAFLRHGAARANFANQARAAGWAAYSMSGFDVEKARSVLKVPEGFAVEVAIAVGTQGATAHTYRLACCSVKSRAAVHAGRCFCACGLFPERFRS